MPASELQSSLCVFYPAPVGLKRDGTTGQLEVDTPWASVPSSYTCDGTLARGVVQATGQTTGHI